MNVQAPASFKPSVSLLAQDDVLPIMWQWHREGLRPALLTLVGIDGTAPRPLGAQMTVAEDGRYFGYLSGGCLERAVALEAQDAIRCGQSRLTRYGRGSKYIDIRLPCGSGLEMYIDCSLSTELLRGIADRIEARRSFALNTQLTSGHSTVAELASGDAAPVSSRQGDLFSRVFLPQPRLLLVGSGPTLTALATLARATGIDTEAWSPDEQTCAQLNDIGLHALATPELTNTAIGRLDAFSAVVLVFHEHDVEPAILVRLLQRDCFYIGVLGNRAVHRQRLGILADLGVADTDLARLRAPVGSIQGAKTRATLAVGILAELMSEAKARNLIA